MYSIDNLLLDEEIVHTNFTCDLEKCKGACCTFPGENGAPLLDDEIEIISKAAKEAKKYLSKKSLEVLESKGFYDGRAGRYTTVCINKRDCVFVYYDGDIAKCALEKAYFAGESEFRKPLSCHLFPVRLGNLGGKYLYYEKIDECRPGVKLGKSIDMPMLRFLDDSLIRLLGLEGYQKLVVFAESKEKNANGD